MRKVSRPPLYFTITVATGALYGLLTGGSTFALLNFLYALVVAVSLGVWVVRSLHGFGRIGKSLSPAIALTFWSTGLYSAWCFWLFRTGHTRSLLLLDPAAAWKAFVGLTAAPHVELTAYATWIGEALGFLVLPVLAGWIEFSSRHEPPDLDVRNSNTAPSMTGEESAGVDEKPETPTENTARILEPVE